MTLADALASVETISEPNQATQEARAVEDVIKAGWRSIQFNHTSGGRKIN
jgi:hypothetical protein